MSTHTATIRWQCDDSDFADNKYSRGHVWEFDGGAIVAASAAPDIVPAPMSVAENVDPEEAFVASLSSCHMLFFLSIAAKRGYSIDEYVDEAIGEMAKDGEGRTSITKVTLRPRIAWSGDKQPTTDQKDKIHHQSHKFCFISNSVKTEIVIEAIS
jgi:organic hydroperoxide reductase OsmC/OhrA